MFAGTGSGRISRRKRGSVQILEMTGDFAVGRHITKPLDLKGHHMEDLAATIRDLLKRNQSRIVLDLAKVNFIDSSGLGELVACKKRTLEAGGDIKILRPAGQVKELLVMTLLTELFDVFDDEDEAVRSFGAT